MKSTKLYTWHSSLSIQAEDITLGSGLEPHEDNGHINTPSCEFFRDPISILKNVIWQMTCDLNL